MKHYITGDSEKTCVEEIASLQTRLTDAEKQRDAYKQEAEFNEDSCKRNQRGWEASEKEKSEMMLKYASAIAANATLQSERDKARAMRDNFLINGRDMAHAALKLKAKLAKAEAALAESDAALKATIEVVARYRTALRAKEEQVKAMREALSSAIVKLEEISREGNDERGTHLADSFLGRCAVYPEQRAGKGLSCGECDFCLSPIALTAKPQALEDQPTDADIGKPFSQWDAPQEKP